MRLPDPSTATTGSPLVHAVAAVVRMQLDPHIGRKKEEALCHLAGCLLPWTAIDRAPPRDHQIQAPPLDLGSLPPLDLGPCIGRKNGVPAPPRRLRSACHLARSGCGHHRIDASSLDPCSPGRLSITRASPPPDRPLLVRHLIEKERSSLSPLLLLPPWSALPACACHQTTHGKPPLHA
ncbi:hypothetical protein COCNU_01G016700 [Cocos nucifera]|uniref:Uncharacterized protein n=1 Tax=Cocos nucifera TaxID=13894 RepID=A0A8K0HWE1_COCNU|nr:hypothetical protein COCNU_01G016700 [Cocos nucifera]